jgi:hypothetical protein
MDRTPVHLAMDQGRQATALRSGASNAPLLVLACPLNELLGTERNLPTPQWPLPCLSRPRVRLVPQVLERVGDGGHVGGAER